MISASTRVRGYLWNAKPEVYDHPLVENPMKNKVVWHHGAENPIKNNVYDDHDDDDYDGYKNHHF